MNKITVCCGIPCSGKSTWSKEEVRKNPNTIRINRDELRIMTTNYVFSQENEQLVISMRDHLLSKALKQGRDIIIDDCNTNRRNFEDICNIARSLNIDCVVMEKPFYIELDEAISRNSKREGFAKIPDDVIKKMWKQTGGKQHQFYKPRIELISNNSLISNNLDNNSESTFNPSLEWCVIADLDGTLSLFNSIRKDGSVEMRFKGAHIRNPYDASKADEDMVNEPLAEILESLHSKGYKIVLCSGRTEEYRLQTETFLNRNLSVPYELLMRKTGDIRSDDIVKKEIYDNNIKSRFNVFCVFDDRLKVCKMWHKLGLMLFRFGDPCADF